MTIFDFILHRVSCTVPSSQCGTVFYKKVQNFYQKVQHSICLSLFFNHLNPLIWAQAELCILTSGLGFDRALYLELWYGLGPSFMPQLLVWAILFMGLFRTLISPPPIAPQIFTLYQRERFNRNSGEIHIAIQSFWMKRSWEKYGQSFYHKIWFDLPLLTSDENKSFDSMGRKFGY